MPKDQTTNTTNNTADTPDDMPEEFSGDDVQDDTNVDMSAVFDREFNDEDDEQEFRKLNPPSGNWDKEDTWEFSEGHNTGDKRDGDFNPDGRTYYNFYGLPKSREANGFEYCPRLFLRISPDKRFKQGKPDEVDTPYNLFLRAKELFLTLNKSRAKRHGDLIKMLQSDAYVIRTMKGDSGPIVLDISPKRTKR